MKIILYQPDIAQNLGAVMRLCACFGTPLEVIEPCGFPMTAKGLRRTAMDYGATDALIRHKSWDNFCDSRQDGRLVLLTTKAATPLPDFTFEPTDRLIFGRESAGAPEAVHSRADARIIIPMSPKVRSFNLATSVSISLYEGLRQTGTLPS